MGITEYFNEVNTTENITLVVGVRPMEVSLEELVNIAINLMPVSELAEFVKELRTAFYLSKVNNSKVRCVMFKTYNGNYVIIATNNFGDSNTPIEDVITEAKAKRKNLTLLSGKANYILPLIDSVKDTRLDINILHPTYDSSAFMGDLTSYILYNINLYTAIFSTETLNDFDVLPNQSHKLEKIINNILDCPNPASMHFTVNIDENIEALDSSAQKHSPTTVLKNYIRKVRSEQNTLLDLGVKEKICQP